MAKGKLTPKQEKFVAEYLVDLNATQAAIRAGYSEKTASAIGHENLNKPEIASAIAAKQAKLSEKTEITTEFVLAGIVSLIKRCEQNEDESVALKGYELLGKHIGLFKDRVEHTGKDGGPIETADVSPRDMAQRAAYLLNRGLMASGAKPN